MTNIKYTPLIQKSKVELIKEIYSLRKKIAELEKKQIPDELDVKQAALEVVKKRYPYFNHDILINRGRTRENVIPRQVYCYLLCKYTHMSLQEIGRSILRDHSTIINARKVVEDVCSYDKKFAGLVTGMANEFKMYLSAHEH